VGEGVEAGADHADGADDPGATVVDADSATAMAVTVVVTGAIAVEVVAAAPSGSDGRTGSVTSAPAPVMTLAECPEDQRRSSRTSGAHKMVATTAKVRVRCRVAGVEDRADAFARGQVKLGPIWRTRVSVLPLTPPGATGSP